MSSVFPDNSAETPVRKIIFLGDYVDPYLSENIPADNVIEELNAVIRFKKIFPDKVVLLLGNHDLSYIFHDFSCSRHDMVRDSVIRDMFLKNIRLFQIAYEIRAPAQRSSDQNQISNHFILSHAGITKTWFLSHKDVFSSSVHTGMPPYQETFYSIDEKEIVSELNDLFEDDPERLKTVLADVSFYRNGIKLSGSPVWADIRDHIDEFKRGNCLSAYQVFGHTLHREGPFACEKFANIDCGKEAYFLNIYPENWEIVNCLTGKIVEKMKMEDVLKIEY